jgi:sarcosine oxidase/L-pipecolate oxidase
VALEGRDALPDEKREAWKWRPEQALNRDIYNVQNRYGGSNKVKDIKDISQWVNAK